MPSGRCPLGPLQLVCLNTSEVGIIERFGKYTYTLEEGLGVYFWPMHQLVKTLSLRVQQLDVSVETKTKDDVFVQIVVSVQYAVKKEQASDAYYKLTNSRQQIQSYIYDVIRSTVPTLELDQAFLSKEDIAVEVRDRLQAQMNAYGFEIKQALVTDLTPDARVRTSMNEINATKRLRMAAQHRAEAEKISLVKQAEAQAESKYLSGVGVANQRKAIVSGFRDSVQQFSEKVSGTSAQDVMTLVLTTQYFDMLGHIGTRNTSTTVFVESEPEMKK